MSISVTQEVEKFRPVTIVIDDVRTANLLRYVLDNFYNHSPSASTLVANVYKIDTDDDFVDAMKDFKTIYMALERLCKY